MGLCLLVETTLGGYSVGLADFRQKEGGLACDLLWFHGETEKFHVAKSLATKVKEGLEAAERSYTDIERVMVSSGPGSFTGVKIGLSFCHGLKAACPQVEFYGCSALDMFLLGLGKLNDGDTVDFCKMLAISSDRKFSAQSAVFLRATREHGFYSLVERPGKLSSHQLNLESLPYSRFAENNVDLMVVDEWPELENLCSNVGLKLDSIPLNTVQRIAAVGMLTEVARSFYKSQSESNAGLENVPAADVTYSDEQKIKFSSSVPVANYMKLSTAEERLLAK